LRSGVRIGDILMQLAPTPRSSLEWRALAWGGNLAFIFATGVHFVVGYSEPRHLAPAILGWTLWNVALLLTKEWLTASAATPSVAHPSPHSG